LPPTAIAFRRMGSPAVNHFVFLKPTSGRVLRIWRAWFWRFGLLGGIPGALAIPAIPGALSYLEFGELFQSPFVQIFPSRSARCLGLPNGGNCSLLSLYIHIPRSLREEPGRGPNSAPATLAGRISQSATNLSYSDQISDLESPSEMDPAFVAMGACLSLKVKCHSPADLPMLSCSPFALDTILQGLSSAAVAERNPAQRSGGGATSGLDLLQGRSFIMH
jgi:hypothetical protein